MRSWKDIAKKVRKQSNFGISCNISVGLLFLLILNCSTSLQTRQDYTSSTDALQNRNLEKAVRSLPNAEGRGFINTLESTYLNLIQGKPEIDGLIKYSKKIDKRLRYSASRELKTFFYLETPEGYYASEHEIIWMHMLLSWGYSLRGDYEKAYVEAKVSSNLLSNNWSEEGRFDDPFLRVMLASLWVLCGHWEEAQVDFRVAGNLDPSLRWAKELADLTEPPANFMLVLGGTGPEPVWDPSLNLNLIRGFRSLKFETGSAKSKLYLKENSENTQEMKITPDSSNWYKRHLVRDNEIQDLILDSRYGQKVMATALKESGRSVLAITGGVSLGVLSIAAGGGLIYLAAQCNCGELSGALASGGVIVMVGGVKLGYELVESSFEESAKNLEDSVDISEEYRFVRFLPEYAWVAYGTEKWKYPVRVQTKSGGILLTVPEGKNSSIISIEFIPDPKN